MMNSTVRNAGDRHRQIRDADRDDRELGDRLEPRLLHQLDAEPDEEHVGGQHAQFDDDTECSLANRSEGIRQHADADVQMLAVAHDG